MTDRRAVIASINNDYREVQEQVKAGDYEAAHMIEDRALRKVLTWIRNYGLNEHTRSSPEAEAAEAVLGITRIYYPRGCK